jgi:hypothetical protein
LPYDVENFCACLLAIQERYPDLQLGVAGGLSGDHGVFDHMVRPIVQAGVRNLMVDASSGLATQGLYDPLRGAQFINEACFVGDAKAGVPVMEASCH